MTLWTWLVRLLIGKPAAPPPAQSRAPAPRTTRVKPPAGRTGAGPRVVYYRTRDGQADYGFSFEPQSDGGYRIYIIQAPDYGHRDESCHITHRLRDEGRFYVCWAGTIATEAQARAVAARWADGTQEYRKHGRTF